VGAETCIAVGVEQACVELASGQVVLNASVIQARDDKFFMRVTECSTQKYIISLKVAKHVKIISLKSQNTQMY